MPALSARELIRITLYLGLQSSALTLPAGAQEPLTLVWGIASTNPLPNEVAFVSGLAADPSNNSYVIGFEGLAPQYRFLTTKYCPNGCVLWQQRYKGQGSGTESRGKAVAVDSSGNVIVTGFSYGDTTYLDYATVKYSLGGQELWVARYSAPGGSTDAPQDIQVGPRGCVYVTGESHSGGTYDFCTVKYDSSGVQLWVARYDGPAHGADRAFRLIVDSLGSVYVLGSSEGIGTSTDFAVVKYDSSGRELWAARYDGADHLEDTPAGFALSKDGAIYVTGTTETVAFPGNLCTLVRVSPAGTVDWSKLWFADRFNYGVDVAVDTSGTLFVIAHGNAVRTDYVHEYCFDQVGTTRWESTGYGRPVRIVAAPWGGAYYATGPAHVGSMTTNGSRGLSNGGSGAPIAIALGGRGNVFFLSSARFDRFVDSLFLEDEHQDNTPEEFSLDQNFPNPFNPTTTIRYGLPATVNVELVVCDILGREVAVLVNGQKAAGSHDVVLDGAGLPSGVYFARLMAGDFVQTRKMLLVR